MICNYHTILISLCLSLPMGAQADTLLIDKLANQPANSSSGLIRPHRGQNMGTVRQQFGNPSEERAPVGTPPISRWVYPQYSVYFENNIVINSVLNTQIK